MEWKYDDDLCVCGTKETEIHVLFECKCYDIVRRRWLRTWDVLEEKERTMDIIKGYVEVNDDVENETMKYLGEVWTKRQRQGLPNLIGRWLSSGLPRISTWLPNNNWW